MQFLRSLWPTPFRVKKGDVISLVIQLVIFLVVCAVVGWLIHILAGIPILGIIFKILGGLMEAYGVIGIVLCVLKFIGIV